MLTICRLPSSTLVRLRRTRSMAAGSTQSLKGSAIAQRAGLAGEHRNVMPGVIDRLAAAERAGMLGDDPAVLADHDMVGIGMDFDWTSDGTGGHGVFVVVEAHQAGL